MIGQPIQLTEPQQKILTRLKQVVEDNKIKVYINEFSPARLEGPVSLDVEHNESGEMVCIGLYNGEYAECWTKITQDLRRFLPNQTFVMHNGVSDIECLRSWGVNIKDSQLIHDTMLLGHILDSSKKDYSLKGMAKRDLGITYPEYDEIVGKHKGKTTKHPACNRQQSDCCGRITLDKQLLEIVSLYNALDCFVTWKLYQRQKKEMEHYV